VRPTVIFGEQNRGNVYNLLHQIARGRFIMFGSGTNRKSMAYVQNIAEFLAFSTQFGPGEHLYNYVDQPELDMNTLVARCRLVLFGRTSVGLRLPGWLGMLVGYGFDILATITRKKLPVSSVRVKKFMKSTAFGSSISNTGFKPSCTLAEGIERTLRYEFLEDHSGDNLFFSE
jgi:GlcNAc-P-P-Und epimerase